MALTINTNVAALNAQRNLSLISQRLQQNYARLSSGLRIVNASDDAAGLAVSERMRGQIRSYDAASRNTLDGISLVQTAEGALTEVSNILNRLRELAISAANGTYSDDDRALLDEEAQALVAEIDRIAGDIEFNGVVLLDGTTTSLDIQVGKNDGDIIQVDLVDVTSETLGVDDVDLTSADDASDSLDVIDDALTDLMSSRAQIGAFQSRLQSAYASIQVARENLAAAESRIRDVDVAAETADMTRNSILQQAAVSVLAQANVQPQLALLLLR